MKSEKRNGYMLLFSGFLIRNSSVVIFKFSQLPVFHVLVGRYLISLPWLCWFTAKKGLSFWPRREHFWPIMATAFTVSFGSLFAFIGFSCTDSVASVVVILKAAMIFGFCLGPFLVGDPWNRHALVAFCLALLGLGFVIGEMTDSVPAILWGIAAGILISLWDVATRWANNRQVSAEQSVLWQSIVSLVVVVPLLIRGQELVSWSWRGVLSIIWIGIATQVVSFLFHFEAHRLIKNVQMVILLSFFEPAMVAVYDRLLNGTSYTISFWLGFCLMIASAWLVTPRGTKRLDLDPI